MIDGWMDEKKEGRKEERRDGWMDGWMEGWGGDAEDGCKRQRGAMLR